MEIVPPQNFELSYSFSKPGTIPIWSIGSSSPVEYLFSDKEEHYFVLTNKTKTTIINIVCTRRSSHPNSSESCWYAAISDIFSIQDKRDLFFFVGTENLINECNKIEEQSIRDILTNFVLSNLDFFSKM